MVWETHQYKKIRLFRFKSSFQKEGLFSMQPNNHLLKYLKMKSIKKKFHKPLLNKEN